MYKSYQRGFMWFIKYAIIFGYIWSVSESSENCPENDGCIYNEETFLLSCRSDIEKTYKNVTHLRLCSYDNTTLYLNNIVKKVPQVENITIILSNVSYLIAPIIENKIKYLKINNATLKRLSGHFFTQMKNLKVLDVRNNSLDRLPGRIGYTQLEAVYLQNNKWNCSLDLHWALEFNKKILRDLSKIMCYDDQFSNKPVLPVAVFLENAKINCPTVCTCTVSNVVRDLNTERLQPIVEANCSNQGLLELPPILPNYTKILHLEKNFITDLSPLIHNRIYRKVLDLYLDYNEVSSIENLEGAKWLSNFRVFSLHSNKLKQLPTYALDNALEQNPNMPDAVQVYLGENPWKCDCTFTPSFQEIIMKYEMQIKDISDIKCTKVEGDENSLKPIISLTRTAVCRPPSESTVRALDLLNIVLASLIVLILSKLAYDYYYFKKSGRLPWIVTKMP